MELKVNYFEFLFLKIKCHKTIAMEDGLLHADHCMAITFPLLPHVLFLTQCGHAFKENSTLFGYYFSLNY